MTDYQPKARSDSLLERSLDGEVLLYDTRTDKAYSLNPTSTAIWELSDGTRSIADIADQLSSANNAPVPELLVEIALTQLAEDGLLANDHEWTGERLAASGLARRAAMKKVGLASAMALPMVMVMAVPAAAQGGSAPVAGNGGTCTPVNDSLCASGNCLPAGFEAGICCAAGSSQANAPQYNICTTDPNAAAFSFRCCSGSASPVTGGAPCQPGETRYVCDPY